jgi:hypothetical protein
MFESQFFDQLAEGVERLHASRFGGHYIYRADETGLDYTASESDVADLGRRLLAGEEDAYSRWCAETDSGELTQLSGWHVGMRVEAGEGEGEDHDTGIIVEVRRAHPGSNERTAEVRICWSNGFTVWQLTDDSLKVIK